MQTRSELSYAIQFICVTQRIHASKITAQVRQELLRDSVYLRDITYSYVFVHTCDMTDQYDSICV